MPIDYVEEITDPVEVISTEDESVEVISVPETVIEVVESSTSEVEVVEVADGTIEVVEVESGPIEVVEVLDAPAGPRGPAGADGVSIVSADIDDDGNLILTDSNGSSINAGSVTEHSGYIHHQGVPALQWNITHDLDFIPNVTVVDSAGTVIEGSIDYTSDFNITASFAFPFAGRAYLS